MLIATEPLSHYAGLFAMRPRSAQRLQAMVSDWLGMRVEVIEFAGAWLSLPPDQRSRIGAIGQFNQLSADAAAGVRAWDPQARIILRIGPLDRATFERLLPDRLALQRLVSLVRSYVGYEIGFAINPVLAMSSVPPLRLDAVADPPPRLGWNTWLEPMAGGQKRLADAADSVFEAEIIEAQSLSPADARALQSGKPLGAPLGTNQGAPLGAPLGTPRGTPLDALVGTPPGAPGGAPAGTPTGTPLGGGYLSGASGPEQSGPHGLTTKEDVA